ncbi:MAG: ferritin [Theionarchaea archaeon]|nr:ferritin [Theionarchaea archaeon]
MISEKMQKALNSQINAELYSSYLYLSMSSFFSDMTLNGFANWMRIQAQEEQVHAMKFYDYLIERGGKVLLSAIDAPPATWKSPLDVFEYTYKHEQKVTGLINDLVNLAIGEKDHAAVTFLNWFVSEQVEEESSANEILQKLKLIKDSPSWLFMMDRELGSRVFTPPATAEKP